MANADWLRLLPDIRSHLVANDGRRAERPDTMHGGGRRLVARVPPPRADASRQEILGNAETDKVSAPISSAQVKPLSSAAVRPMGSEKPRRWIIAE